VASKSGQSRPRRRPGCTKVEVVRQKKRAPGKENGPLAVGWLGKSTSRHRGSAEVKDRLASGGKRISGSSKGRSAHRDPGRKRLCPCKEAKRPAQQKAPPERAVLTNVAKRKRRGQAPRCRSRGVTSEEAVFSPLRSTGQSPSSSERIQPLPPSGGRGSA